MSNQEKNPWKTLSSREVYKNPWIRVREDQVICPDGSQGIYGVVESRVATAILALTDNEELYLVGQYRYPTEYYSWEIIEGGAEVGETPLQAAQRELEEEAGLMAESWRQLGSELHLSNCHSSEVGCVFIARGISQVEAKPEATEQLTVRKVPFEQALAMVADGTIKDAFSVVSILLYNSQRTFEPKGQ